MKHTSLYLTEFMAYSGKYQPKNYQKYKGDSGNIIFRSLWEYHVMRWCDLNPDVVKWSSEEFCIPYICKTDGQPHRYFPDFLIEFKNGKKVLVEVKPKYQTKPPEKKRGKSEEKFLSEALTYMKNESKWEAALSYSRKQGYIFQVWDENTLQSIGIMTNIPNHVRRK
jgi:hypothetical protein